MPCSSSDSRESISFRRSTSLARASALVKWWNSTRQSSIMHQYPSLSCSSITESFSDYSHPTELLLSPCESSLDRHLAPSDAFASYQPAVQPLYHTSLSLADDDDRRGGSGRSDSRNHRRRRSHERTTEYRA